MAELTAQIVGPAIGDGRDSTQGESPHRYGVPTIAYCRIPAGAKVCGAGGEADETPGIS
jgi:hypothetical protein